MAPPRTITGNLAAQPCQADPEWGAGIRLGTPSKRNGSFRKKRVELLGAIDIGSSWVAAAYAELDSIGHPTLVDCEMAPSYGIRGGDIVDMNRATDALRIPLNSLAARLPGRITKWIVGCSLDARLAVARGSRRLGSAPRAVEEVDVARLRKSLHPDGGKEQRIIHRFDGPYAVGDLKGIERPVGLVGRNLDMVSTFVTASAERVTDLEYAIRRAGAQIEMLVIAPLSASFGALTDDERNLGVAILDLGSGCFRSALWEGGRLRRLQAEDGASKNIPMGVVPPKRGVEGLVRALARRFRVPPSVAGNLLIGRDAYRISAAESGGPPVEVAAVDGLGAVLIEPAEWDRALEEFVSPVIRDLRDGLAEFSTSHAGGVVLVGQGAQIRGLPAIVGRHFGGASVRLGEPSSNFAGIDLVSRASGDRENELATLKGPGGCALHGLLHYGATQRRRQQSQGAHSWWQRFRTRLNPAPS